VKKCGFRLENKKLCIHLHRISKQTMIEGVCEAIQTYSIRGACPRDGQAEIIPFEPANIIVERKI
jgi:hypothetical protein